MTCFCCQITHCRPTQYTIQINKYNDSQSNIESKSLQSLKPSLLIDYLEEQTNMFPRNTLQVFNYSLKQYLPPGDIESSKIIFSMNRISQPVPGNVVTIHGYFRTLRPTQEGVAITIDIIRKFFHKTTKILEFIKAVLDYKGENLHDMKGIFDKNM